MAETQESIEDQIKASNADLGSLSRVSHRLAMVDTTEKLSQVLDKLLPRLLQRIGDNHDAQKQAVDPNINAALSKIHAKLVEMLSHTMKRVRDDQKCQIPCQGIIQLLLILPEASNSVQIEAKGTVDPFTLNLSLAFLTLGLSRCETSQLEALLPGLLVLHGFFSSSVDKIAGSASTKSQWHQITHLLFRTMDHLMQTEEEFLKRTPTSSFSSSTAASNQQNKRLKKANESAEKTTPSSSTAGTVTSSTSPTASTTGASPQVMDSLQVARTVLANNEVSAGAAYDLLLDLLLYQTVAGNVPPSGLSQAGHVRLKSGYSDTARDWAAEMAPRSRLVQAKCRLLDWIAPSRRWGLLLGHTETLETSLGKENEADEGSCSSTSQRGTARTIALLIAAAGDPTPEVSQRAMTYLKQHLDSKEQRADPREAYGDPLILLQELLVLCVGASNAQLALSNNRMLEALLGLTPESTNQQAVLSFKRRMVSETIFATMVNYVSRILEEVPHLGDDAGQDTQQLANVGTLAVLSCTKMLSQLRTSSGLTVLRGKQYMAAAQLLNALVVRISALDEMTALDSASIFPSLMAKSMAVACTCLSTVTASKRNVGSSTSNIGSSGSEGNTSVRDSLYGVICVLSRSNLPLEKISWLFSLGKTSTSEDISVSIETATLLFGCITGEQESLRPRAVAALDALLASYCRLLSNSSVDIEHSPIAAASDNPWGTIQPPQDTTMATEDAIAAAPPVFPRDELAKRLLPLLWNACQHSQPKQSRVAAARWSSDLLTLLDLTSSCHILCFLAGDSDITASNIASEGLGLSKDGKKSDESFKSLADFAEVVHVVFSDVHGSSTTWRPNYWEFTAKGMAMTIQYLLKCLLHDIYGGDDDAMQIFVAALAQSVLNAASQGRESLGLLDECCGALSLCLSTSSFARSLVASQNTPLSVDEIRELSLTSNSSKARRFLADAWGYLYKDSLLWENDKWAETVEESLRSCKEIIDGTISLGSKHGAAFLGGTCIKVYRQHPTLNASDAMANLASSVLGSMGNEISNSDDVIGNAFSDGLAIALSYDNADSPVLEDALVIGATNALDKLADALRKYGNGENIDVPRVSKLAKSAGSCLAATTISASVINADVESGTTSARDNLGFARLKCIDALFLMLGSTAFRKDEEVALWAGEALALYCDAYSPKDVTWSTSKDVWPAEMDDEFAKGLPPHQQVIYTLLRRARLENSPQKRTSSAPALFAIVATAAKKVNLDSDNSHRCLVQELCARLDEVQGIFISLLSDPKSKHLSRESCCLGLAACRSLANIPSSDASEDMNSRLLKAFGQTTNHGGSAMQETQEQAAQRRRTEGSSENRQAANDMDIDAEVGGASGIGEASLGAYREMASAAVSLGRPDILYALLMLSVSNPAWVAEGRDYSASALLGQNSFLGSRGNVAEMRTALKSHLGKLIPRILRGCHSSNKETREQMQNLWNGLTGGGAEARSAITEHLELTVDTLINDTTSKLWRTRLGACGALAQVIVGRSWKELGGGPAVLFDDEVVTRTITEVTTAGIRFLRLWRVAMRSLDDVRVNVREAGEALGRGIRGLTLRLVDPKALKEEHPSTNEGTMHEKDASAAAATALRWLIKHGLNQPCPEAAGVCISCLVGIVDVANPNILQPLVPDLLRSLLLSMSSLEPSAFNYLQVRAAGQDRGSSDTYDALERLRLQVVQSGPLATAVTKCLDMMPRMDLKIQKAVVPELDSAIRLSAGLTTRTAAADCVSTLCATCPNAFRNNGSSSTNPSVSLLRALYSASERERGQAARDKYAHACGNLAALCPGASVRSLALRASEKYNRSTGSNDDPAARKAAAITLRAIAVKASDQFADGGTSDVWCRRVLPVAFLGMKDPDAKVASLFSDVWEEGGSAANFAGAADGFGNLLEEKLILSLVNECEKALNDVSWSRRVIGANALEDLAKKEILSPAPRRLKSAPKAASLESTLRAQRRAQASNKAMVALVKLIAETRLWSGKHHVVESCCAIASKWSSMLANVEDPSEVLGVKNGTQCTWSPVSFTAAEGAGDLFVNDGWFKEDKMEEELPEEANQGTDEKMDIDKDGAVSDGKISFEEGDEAAVPVDDKLDPLTTATGFSTTDIPILVPTYIGLCHLLLVQAFPSKRSTLSVKEEEILPYRAAVLKAFKHLFESIDASLNEGQQKKIAFPHVSDKLAPVFETVEDETSKEPPLIVSRAIDCFAACFWEGFGSDIKEGHSSVFELSKIFECCAEQDRPWTVKSSSLKACARLVSKSCSESLRNHATISTLVECAAVALKDRKFWRVRLAGLELLYALVGRAGKARDGSIQIINQDAKSKEQQLILEALLPQKEAIVKLAKRTLSDSEANVTALASNILSAISWWP